MGWKHSWYIVWGQERDYRQEILLQSCGLERERNQHSFQRGFRNAPDQSTRRAGGSDSDQREPSGYSKLDRDKRRNVVQRLSRTSGGRWGVAYSLWCGHERHDGVRLLRVIRTKNKAWHTCYSFTWLLRLTKS